MTVGELKWKLSKYKDSMNIKVQGRCGQILDVYRLYSPSEWPDDDEDPISEEDRNTVYLET